jgi:hypothetical protein
MYLIHNTIYAVKDMYIVDIQVQQTVWRKIHVKRTIKQAKPQKFLPSKINREWT